MSGDGVFVDEAHFIKRRCIENGPIAMLGQNARIMLASTPATGESGITNILEGKVDGEDICTKVDFDFNCPACKRRQLENPGITCVHRFHLRPHIQNINAIMVARAAYGADSDAFKREMMGSSVFGSHAFIDPESIETLRTAPAHEPRRPPKFVFVSCDPSGCTRHYIEDHTSAYALVTAFVDQNQYVVSLFSLHFLFSLFFFSSPFLSQ